MQSSPAPPGEGKGPGFLFLVAAAGSGGFIIQLVVLMMGPLLVDISRDLGVAVPVAGQLNTITAAVWLVVGVTAGYFSDRHGRKLILLIGLGGAAVGVLGMSLSQNFAMAMFFRGVTGLGGLIPPTFGAFLADFIPLRRRGRAMGWMTAASGLAVVVGVPLSTVMGELAGWRWSFVAASVITWSVWVFVLLKLPNPPPVGNASGGILSRFAPLARIGLIWELSLVNVSHRVAYFAFTTYFAAYLIINHNLSTGGTALPLAVISVGTVISPAAVGYLADSRHRLKAMALGLAVGGVLALVIFNVEVHLILLVVLGLLFTTAIFVPFTVFATLMAIIGGRRLRGAATNLPSFSNQTGSVLGPAIGGLALSMGGYGAVGLAIMVAAGLGSLLAATRTREGRLRAVIERLDQQDI